MPRFKHYSPNETAISDEVFSAYSPLLTQEDDVAFWAVAVRFLLGDTLLYVPEDNQSIKIIVQFGACSHWLRPHQTRLTGAGGFALPSGYLGGRFSRVGLPEFDWSKNVQWDNQGKEWQLLQEAKDKRAFVRRIALPTRTIRHRQAAIDARWVNGTRRNPKNKSRNYFGFRKDEEAWKCVLVTNSLGLILC